MNLPITILRRAASVLDRHRIVVALLLLLLALPHVVQADLKGPGFHLGLSTVCSGDEPHYLVMTNSVIEDGDLDLANQYDEAARGGLEAGQLWAGFPLDHHTWLVRGDGGRTAWSDVFEVDPPRWNRDAAGHPVPTPRTAHTEPGAREYGNHPPGVAFLVCPFLYPAAGTRFVEPLALALSAVATLLTCLAFLRLGRHFSASPRAVHVAALLLLAATPLWHYSRTFFNEPYLAALATWAYAFALVDRKPLWAGVLLGVGAQMKPPFLLLAIPLAVEALLDRSVRRMLLLGIGPAISTLVVLWLNFRAYGSPFQPPQAFTFGNPLIGAAGLLFSGTKGLFLFAPVLVFAVVGLVLLSRSHSRLSATIVGAVFAYFALMATWSGWSGGLCFGPRLIVPILPLLALGLIPVLERMAIQKLAVAFWLAAALSIQISAAGALYSCRFWDHHPLERAVRILSAHLA